MSLNLHPECKKRLIQKLTEVLPQIMIEKNMFILRSTTHSLRSAEIILPEFGELKKNLENYIGEEPFYEFVLSYLSKQLSANQKYESVALPIKLTDLENYSAPEKVAQQIVEEFDSLPWEYTISFKLGNEFVKYFNERIKNHILSESVLINSPDEEFINQYPLKDNEDKILETPETFGGIINLLFNRKLEWDKNSTYINLIIKGFVDRYGTSSTFENSILLLKTFLGLGIALKLFKFGYNYLNSINNVEAIVNRKIDTKWIVEGKLDLDRELSERIIDLVPEVFNEEQPDHKKNTVFSFMALNEMKFVFSNLEKAKKVVSASQWYFDSSVGTNELLSFIQLTIAIEILLGDKAATDLIGLGELLGNRCAYLIGESSSQRENILKEFKEIYRIRSRIVHSGERKLNYYERTLYNTLRWMCNRVIFEEIQLMKKDE